MVRESTVIALRNHPKRYNVIYGRETLNKDVGAVTLVKRAFNQAGLNKYVPRTANALGEISDFLKLNNEKKAVNCHITENHSKYNPFKLINDAKILKIDGDDTSYKLYKSNNDYHLWIPDKTYYNNNRHLHIKAKDDDDFRLKLESLFNNASTRAKLDFKVYNIPLGLRNIFISGLPRHEIFLDDNRLTGAYQENTYKAVGLDGDLEAFDSKLGSVDRKQITYYTPNYTFEGYSERDKPLIVRDDTWVKSHEAAQFVNASHECDELLEMIIAQTYSGQQIDQKHTAQMATKLKEDYIHNLYGYGTLNGRTKGQTILPYGDTPKDYQFLNDPLRGGRIWEEHAPSNQEIAMIMYEPQIDGTAKLRYDTDKKAFLSIVDRLKITPKDRQYMMNYARKALGIKIAMKFIQDELSNIKLDDPILSPEEKNAVKEKWQDLSYIKDQLFNNAGDLRDSLRKGNVGFSAYAEAVGLKTIPKLKDMNHLKTKGIPDKKGFVTAAADGLGEIAENYPYFENFWGWQGRDYLGRSLYKIFAEQLFDRKVPPIIANNAVVMLTEALDYTGRRLKLFNDVYDRDADLASLMKKLSERLNRNDYSTAGDIINQQKIRLSELFQGKKDYSDTAVKRLALQGEGVLFEEEVFPKYKGSYLGDNNGLFVNNMSEAGVLAPFYWQETNKIALKLLPTIVDLARFMKAHQAKILHSYETELTAQSNNSGNDAQKRDAILKKVYACPEMSELDNYIKSASHEMALRYFEKNKATFNNGADEDLRILFKHVRKEYTNLLQMTANVVAMVAYNPKILNKKSNSF